MIVDNSEIFSDSQAITATADSTNTIDLGAPGTPYGAPVAVEQDIGKGLQRIPLAVNVTQGFNNLTSLTIALQVSPDNSTFKVVSQRTYLAAEIAAVGQLDFPAHFPNGTNARYAKLTYTVAGTAPTTGKIFAAPVAARQSNNH